MEELIKRIEKMREIVAQRGDTKLVRKYDILINVLLSKQKKLEEKQNEIYIDTLVSIADSVH